MEELKNLIESAILHLNYFVASPDSYFEKRYISRFEEGIIVDSDSVNYLMVFSISHKNQMLLIRKFNSNEPITDEQKIMFFKEILLEIICNGLIRIKTTKDEIETRDNNTRL